MPAPKISTGRELTWKIRARLISRWVTDAAVPITIVALIGGGALMRKPEYGLWPIIAGGVVAGAAVVWSYCHYHRQLYFAVHGVDRTAVVIRVFRGRRSRCIELEYVYGGRVFRSSDADPDRAFADGADCPILVDPREPGRCVRRDKILFDKPHE